MAGSQKVIGSNPLSSISSVLRSFFYFLTFFSSEKFSVRSENLDRKTVFFAPTRSLRRAVLPRSSNPFVLTSTYFVDARSNSSGLPPQTAPINNKTKKRRKNRRPTRRRTPISSVSVWRPQSRQKRNCRRASKDATATLTDKFKLRICGRIGIRKPRSGFVSQKESGKPRDSGPKTKTSPRRYSTAS